MTEQTIGMLGLFLAALVQGVLAYLIGVRGKLFLISNYRPESYPDGRGLGRWMGWTLALGSLGFAVAGIGLGAGWLSDTQIGVLTLATAAVLVTGSIWGLIRFHGRPAPKRRR